MGLRAKEWQDRGQGRGKSDISAAVCIEPRKERSKQEMVSQLPPPKLPLPLSAAPEPKGFSGKGFFFPGSRDSAAPTGSLWHLGVQQQTWHPKKSPRPGRGARLLRDPRAGRGFPSLQEVPAGILEQPDPPWHLGPLIFPFKPTAAFPATHPCPRECPVCLQQLQTRGKRGHGRCFPFIPKLFLSFACLEGI